MNNDKLAAKAEREAAQKKFRDEVAQFLVRISFYLELIIAFFVIILIIYGVISLLINFANDAGHITNLSLYSSYLEKALTIVIGIEFLKMLCRHSLSSVVEVIMFYLSRHLIVSETSMLEGLFCVMAMAGLFAIRKFLFIPKVDDPTLDVREEPYVYLRRHSRPRKDKEKEKTGHSQPNPATSAKPSSDGKPANSGKTAGE